MRQARRSRSFTARMALAMPASTFGGIDVLEAKRLKALEDENAKSKWLLAEAMLDTV